MTQILGLSDKNFKTAIIKMTQGVRVYAFEKNGMIECFTKVNARYTKMKILE